VIIRNGFQTVFVGVGIDPNGGGGRDCEIVSIAAAELDGLILWHFGN
jgi:hypothetical protein